MNQEKLFELADQHAILIFGKPSNTELISLIEEDIKNRRNILDVFFQYFKFQVPSIEMDNLLKNVDCDVRNESIEKILLNFVESEQTLEGMLEHFETEDLNHILNQLPVVENVNRNCFDAGWTLVKKIKATIVKMKTKEDELPSLTMIEDLTFRISVDMINDGPTDRCKNCSHKQTYYNMVYLLRDRGFDESEEAFLYPLTFNSIKCPFERKIQQLKDAFSDSEDDENDL